MESKTKGLNFTKILSLSLICLLSSSVNIPHTEAADFSSTTRWTGQPLDRDYGYRTRNGRPRNPIRHYYSNIISSGPHRERALNELTVEEDENRRREGRLNPLGTGPFRISYENRCADIDSQDLTTEERIKKKEEAYRECLEGRKWYLDRGMRIR